MNGSETAWGKDKFNTKVVSAANKTGIDLRKKGITLTPALGLSYMGIDTDDYVTKAGTKIENDFMNVFIVAPELKLTKDFGQGILGYAKVAYKMFYYSNNEIRADGVLLPEMSAKPYAEYTIGGEWNEENAKLYGEVSRHDGGRKGWDVNLGLKLDF